MKLNQFIKELQVLKKIHGNIDLVYSKDDEGNGFSEVFYSPTAGNFNDGEFNEKSEDINVICIN